MENAPGPICPQWTRQTARFMAGSFCCCSVLSSPKTGRSSNDGAVLDALAMEEITVPTLISSHEQDECEWTLFHNARQLLKRLKKSAKSGIVSFRGGSPGGSQLCGTQHYHSYAGIGQEVVNRMADRIKAALRINEAGK